MSEQPEHVEPLWSRVDDLEERHESFNSVLGLHSAQIGVVQRTLDDLSREMADRFHGATSTFGNLNDRIHALEAQVSRVIDLVAYQARPDGGLVADRRLMTDPCTCGHPENYHHTHCRGNDPMGISGCRCEVFRPVEERTADDLTIARMEALEEAIDYITMHISHNEVSMAVCRDRLQTWLDELSDPAVPR